MGQNPRPLFLARGTYRQRRLRDAARLLPVMGALLWMIPLLWPRGADGQLVSLALLYIFGVWAGLIALTLILSRALRTDDDIPGPEQPAGPPDA
jgi:hypothetical protein